MKNREAGARQKIYKFMCDSDVMGKNEFMVEISPGKPFSLTTREVGPYNLVEHSRLLYIQEQLRYLFLGAARHAFSRIYHESFKGNERVLEVGSGLGFLRRCWLDESKFKGTWIELDFQIPFLEEAKRLNPDGVYVGGSADSLPFPTGSLDVVCGLASYDELPNLEKAVQEASRVLKTSGLFLHMLDIVPSNRAPEDSDKDFHTRLCDALSQEFDRSTIGESYSIGVVKQKRGLQHKKARTSEGRDAFVLAYINGKFYITDYDHRNFRQFLEGELMYAPKETIDELMGKLEPYHSQRTYGLRRTFHLGEKPPVLEIAAIRYTAARK